MTKAIKFDLILPTNFEAVFQWLEYYQEDYGTNFRCYFIVTKSVTKESAVFYYLCHKKGTRDTQYNPSGYTLTLPRGGKMIGSVSIEVGKLCVQIKGITEDEYKDSDLWQGLISKIEFTFPGLTKYAEIISKESSNQIDQISEEDIQVENSSRIVTNESKKDLGEKTSSSSDAWRIELVAEMDRLKKIAQIEHPLQYDYYAIARWNHCDDINDICHGINDTYSIKIGKERLSTRMSEIRRDYPKFEIIKRNEYKC